MKISSKHITLFAIVATTLFSCSKPSDDYAFISRQEALRNNGSFDFEINLDDTLMNYTTYVAARLVTPKIDSVLTLDICITSPTGQPTVERVAFPVARFGDLVTIRNEDGMVKDIEWPYRENIFVLGSSLGKWKVSISVVDPTQFKHIYGLGFSFRGTEWGKEN